MKYFRDIFIDRDELSVRYDQEDKAIWLYLNPKDRPRLSVELVNNILEVSKAIQRYYENSGVLDKFPVNFFVVASQTKNIFNYGGDLGYFIKLVEENNKDELYRYTKLCVDNVYLFNVNLNLPLETIALVQGTALGGGFELALSCSTLIAQESAKMGFPESRFNLFPGVGGYTFLARKNGIRVAEEMIKSGKIYLSKELLNMGVINEMVNDDEGVSFVKKYMKKQNKNFKSHLALLKARQIHMSLSYDELMKIAKLWMDMVFRLSKNDIKAMKRLINAQDSKNINNSARIRTYQDRRIFFDESVVKAERRKKERRSA